ncbi:hypothetical protein IJH02_00070 [Candidatus Saccharibacteria bacterium]|nr:hypothetical protein [Candidatus Saccharibacteria bacterium]
MPQQSKKIPTLIDWYLTDLSGNPIERDTFFRTIKKLGKMSNPEYNFGLVGKRFFDGDEPEDAPAIYAKLLSIECLGKGAYRIVTERCREYIIHRDNMASQKRLAEL